MFFLKGLGYEKILPSEWQRAFYDMQLCVAILFLKFWLYVNNYRFSDAHYVAIFVTFFYMMIYSLKIPVR